MDGRIGHRPVTGYAAALEIQLWTQLTPKMSWFEYKQDPSGQNGVRNGELGHVDVLRTSPGSLPGRKTEPVIKGVIARKFKGVQRGPEGQVQTLEQCV